VRFVPKFEDRIHAAFIGRRPSSRFEANQIAVFRGAYLSIEVEMPTEGAVAVRPKKLTLFSLLFLALSGSPAWALSRYECKGVASETTVLTPFEDGSVDLSFNKGPVKATANFMHKDDVFMAEFANLERAGASYMVVFDTLTKNGYEIVRLPNLPTIATKITCWWFDN
jgi:hypothetical protein